MATITQLFGNIDKAGQPTAKFGDFTVKAQEDREGRGQDKGYYSVTYGSTCNFAHPPTVVATAESSSLWGGKNVTIYNSGLDGFDVFIKKNSGDKTEAAWDFLAIYASES